ncbi:S41 family peptidase [Acidocella sp.]|uniref:S41 family peptidase n=1 Tax=Acidocella sp. TaxID=50710 RepID=UPI0026353677|nr:S41 family peptidase [Acidocella sp.]
MRRKATIILLCLLLPAAMCCRSANAAATFNASDAANVWSAALAYIEPRALNPVTIPQMALWGLNGLAALDPNLNTTLQDKEIRLYGPNSLLLAIPAPAPTDAAGWGQASARVAAAAYAASPALQRAGTQGIIGNFFDELFNHFDPYSRYEAPAQAAQDQLMITGLAGTGLTLAGQGRRVIVSSVAADSPASDAGLQTGMIVSAVNGRAAYPAIVDSLNNEMDGLAGTRVTLSVTDPQMGKAASSEALTLIRGYIPPQTVFNEPPVAPGTAVLRITGFNKGTGDQFASLLEDLMSQPTPPTGLVLDLRGNRGGVLRQAVLVADSLLPSGVIARTKGRDPDADQTLRAEGADLTDGARIVVLVDGQTASAAEILAAALADNGRAVVIGSETLGKGLVQTVTSLPDGGELYVTWSRVLAPLGWPLQGLGLMPQVCTSNGAKSVDQQLAMLAKGENLMAPALSMARSIRPPVGVDAILAVRGNCPADIGGALDEQAAAAVLGNQKIYNAALLH